MTSSHATYRSCAAAAAATPQGCTSCGGVGYIRPDGGTYANASQAAQARRRGTSTAKAAVRCGCCRGTGAHSGI